MQAALTVKLMPKGSPPPCDACDGNRKSGHFCFHLLYCCIASPLQELLDQELTGLCLGMRRLGAPHASTALLCPPPPLMRVPSGVDLSQVCKIICRGGWP